METLQRTANRGSISTGYDIDNSCKFEIDNSEYLGKTFGSSGNRKAWTWSSWVKRTELNSSTTYQLLFSAGTGNPPRDVFFFDDDTDDTLCFFSNGGLFSSTTLGFRTNAVFRDTSAWYHIVLVLDTANSTAADRLKLYVNGVSQTFSTYNAPTQNADSLINSNTDHAIGRDSSFAALGFDAQYFSGYMAETHFVDGSALAPTEFGEFDDDSGIWKPKAYTGSYGSNGFYLDFADAADLGDDESGNGNDWTEGNLSAADQATDTPTNNFCTLNPLSAGGNLGNVITEGATKVVIENSGQQVAVGTIAVTKGKWYWEAKHTSGTYQLAGIISADSRVSGNGGVADSSVAGSDAIALYRVNGQVFYNGTGTAFDTNGYANGDIIGVALDMDNGTCALYEDGVLMGNTGTNDIVAKSGHASLTGAWTAMYSDGTNGTFNITYEVNFGGYHTYTISSGNTDENGYGNFEYAPPSGYYALCTKNLAEYG